MTEDTRSIRTVRAVKGRKVRHPGSGMVLAEATPVAWTSYWERLLRDGDIKVTDSPADEPPAAPAEAAASKKG